LQFIQTSKGRLVPDDNGGYDYEYAIKDHLGNTRVMFDETGEVLQDQSYYPFGMSMGEALTFDMPSSLPDNKYLYNGKELQDDFDLGWYDYGARFYDLQLARFHAIDKLSEKYYSWSPFVYVGNNPIKRVDPNGNDWWDVVNGSVRGVTDNMLGTNTRANYTPNDAADYNNALTKADITSVIAGTGMTVAGGYLAVGGGAAAVPSGGTSLVASAAGVGIAAEGTFMAANGVKNLQNGNNYGELKEPRNVGKGKKTTPAQRKRILEENKKRNNGQLKSDGDGRTLDQPKKVKKGEKANMNQAEVDHIVPKSKGGSNSNSNMQVLSKEEILKKGNR
jgi:RHS repeat-associated protein